MHVAFDVGPLRPRPAGVGTYVRSLAHALRDVTGLELTFIGRRPDAAGLPEDVRSLRRSPRLPYPAWVELLGTRDALRAGADVTHYTDGLVPLIRRGRVVVTVHDLTLVNEWRTHRAIRYPRIPFILVSPRLADRVIADSRATADQVIRRTGTPARRIDIVPLAADPRFVRAQEAEVAEVVRRYGLEPDGYILVTGTTEPRKNHVRLIAAFDHWVARTGDADTHLAIAGSPGWGHAAVVRAARASVNAARIVIPGYIPLDDLPALMTASVAVAYPSLAEGFGLPVLEAMACGAPVVTSNVSATAELQGPAVIHVDPLDPAAIAEGIALAVEARRGDDVIAAAQARAAAVYSWERTAAATIAVYEALRGRDR